MTESRFSPVTLTGEIPQPRIIVVTNPAAGAEIVLPVSGVGNWLITSIALLFTTSAAVANRLVTLTVDDGTTVYGRYGAPAVQAATVAQRYTGFLGSTGGGTAGNLTHLSFPSEGIYLPQGFTLRTATQNIDVADQYSAIGIKVVEAPTGPDNAWYLPTGLTQRGRD